MTTVIANILSLRNFRLSLVFLIAFSIPVLHAESLKKIIDLEGDWKFTVGDDPAWAEVDYNDSDWDIVSVPGSWESEGFADYNGFAWYRKGIHLNKDIEIENMFLVMGYIDDVDEVYLNGHLIGATGTMPTPMTTAHRFYRKYPFPVELLNTNGKNVIAIRVFDEYGEGGIYAGPVGVFYDEDQELLSLNLAGYWDFEIISKEEYTAGQLYNQNNGKIYVPGYWESLGFHGFDGIAVYSTTFSLPSTIDEQDLMIVLGYIDDIDNVFINGVAIGSVENPETNKGRDEHFDVILRGYKIPPGTLKHTRNNILEVRVIDTGGLGGIYEGPVGLITEKEFETLNRIQEPKPSSFWEFIYYKIFN